MRPYEKPYSSISECFVIDSLSYPKEEQDCDQAQRINGFSQRELGSMCAFIVAIAQRGLLEETHIGAGSCANYR